MFEHAYCASPLCVPSRGSLLTSMLPSRSGAFDNGAELAASVPTFAHVPARARLPHGAGRQDALRRARPAARVRGAGDRGRLSGGPRLGARLDARLATSACRGTTTCRACDAPGPCAPRCSSTTTRRSRSARGARSSTALAPAPANRCCWSRPSRIPHDPYEVPRRLWESYADVEIEPPGGSAAPARRAGSAQPAAPRDVRARSVSCRRRSHARRAARLRGCDQPRRRARRIAARDARGRGDGRRHDGRRLLRPRRHARRARALVQDVVLRRVGAGPARRAPSRPRRAAAS